MYIAVSFKITHLFSLFVIVEGFKANITKIKWIFGGLKIDLTVED